MPIDASSHSWTTSSVAEAWRLLDPGPLPAWQQMALDAVVIRHRSQGSTMNTLRFMEFQPHTVLVGYHQDVDQEIHRTVAERRGIDISRRITGGGTIYMDARQLGWEFCLGRDAGVFGPEPDSIYRKLSQVVVETLNHWKIPARFRPVNDVEVNGRKISGTGGVQFGDAVIYQGTLLIEFDVETMLETLKLPIQKLTDKVVRSFQERVVTMAELLGDAPAMSCVKAMIAEKTQEILGISLEKTGLTTAEEMDWIEGREAYRSSEWIELRRAPKPSYRVVEVSHKAPGGLLRLSLEIDDKFRRIRKMFLTGDFFVTPTRAVYDLEALMKDAPARMDVVHDRIRSHLASGATYLGVAEADWIDLFARALSDTHHEPKGAMS